MRFLSCMYSVYCGGYSTRKMYHHASIGTAATTVQIQLCEIWLTPATRVVPVATIVEGWHHQGLVSHTLRLSSLAPGCRVASADGEGVDSTCKGTTGSVVRGGGGAVQYTT
jgi:hypothetical protein